MQQKARLAHASEIRLNPIMLCGYIFLNMLQRWMFYLVVHKCNVMLNLSKDLSRRHSPNKNRLNPIQLINEYYFR